MSAEQSKIENDDEHDLITEEGEESHLEDVVPRAAEAESAGDADDNEDSIEVQLEKAQATIKDYWEQMMRLRAEIENNRKRAERDIESAHKYANRSLIESLLPVIDSMEMGLAAAAGDNATLESIREGSELTTNMLVQVLERSGLEQIDPLGEKFDPDRHQAIKMTEAEDAESGAVVEVMQKGFLLNDRLVRPAMVIVAK